MKRILGRAVAYLVLITLGVDWDQRHQILSVEKANSRDPLILGNAPRQESI